MTHAEYVAALRRAADFLEAHSELGVPTTPLEFTYAGYVASTSVDTQAGLARFIQIVGGKIEKHITDMFYKLESKQNGFTVNALAYREKVCHQVQVGTKIAPAVTIPATPEQVLPEREVPIYEWACPESLLAAEKEAS
jgi:hypothetical protein